LPEAYGRRFLDQKLPKLVACVFFADVSLM